MNRLGRSTECCALVFTLISSCKRLGGNSGWGKAIPYLLSAVLLPLCGGSCCQLLPESRHWACLATSLQFLCLRSGLFTSCYRNSLKRNNTKCCGWDLRLIFLLLQKIAGKWYPSSHHCICLHTSSMAVLLHALTVQMEFYPKEVRCQVILSPWFCYNISKVEHLGFAYFQLALI